MIRPVIGIISFGASHASEERSLRVVIAIGVTTVSEFNKLQFFLLGTTALGRLTPHAASLLVALEFHLVVLGQSLALGRFQFDLLLGFTEFDLSNASGSCIKKR